MLGVLTLGHQHATLVYVAQQARALLCLEPQTDLLPTCFGQIELVAAT